MLLNGICPYFTMFPLSFPLGVLKRHGADEDVVLDPFAGRGTTLYAGRLSGLKSYGVDSNPVAAAVSEAKVANTTPGHIVAAAKRVMAAIPEPQTIPEGEFWEAAFHSDVLREICRLREGLLANCESDARKALRAVIMGALHGPRAKTQPSYFSNQCPRTYAPKPRYSVKFWRERNMTPPTADVLDVIARRAKRYFGEERSKGRGMVVEGDSQAVDSFAKFEEVKWIITSPPYYGMRTYIPDQWLRRWFVGGPSEVDYSNAGQIAHSSQEVFAEGLRMVWKNCATVAAPGCRMVVRFGAINDRKVDALELVKKSLAETRWELTTARRAGTAAAGKRQADAFVTADGAIEEYDVWAVLAA